MAAHNRNGHQLWVAAHNLGHKLVRAHHIQGGHSKQLLRVVLASRFQHLRCDGDGGVDGVGDDGDPGVGAVVCNTLDKSAHDAGVDVEEVVTGHAGLTGHACGDDDQIAAGEAGAELCIAAVSSNLGATHITVGQVASNALHDRCHIVEAQLTNQRRATHEHGQRLPDAASSAHDSHLEHGGGLQRVGGPSNVGQTRTHIVVAEPVSQGSDTNFTVFYN
mmetsp:Transcript_23178/g.41172  ORF Transcript_23178/g.41172 Transcript_23178/m.41172 type:complete len:219 (+) Transcript_23178:606-1262(+)